MSKYNTKFFLHHYTNEYTSYVSKQIIFPHKKRANEPFDTADF